MKQGIKETVDWFVANYDIARKWIVCYIDTILWETMDSLLNKQFERCLMEFRLVDEVKECMNDILFQLEINERDRTM